MLLGFLLVLKAEIMRMWIVMRRYWFATILGIMMGYGTLIVMIYAFMYNRELITEYTQEWAENAMKTTLGFIAGVWAFGITGLFTQGLQGMARTGELEQVCMSPYGLITNFIARSFVMAVQNVLSLTITIWLVAWTVQGKLHFHPVMVPVVFFLTYINLIGFGFMVGGLVLVFKQTGQIAMILRFSMIALATIVSSGDIYTWDLPLQIIVHLLPITDAAICLRMVVIENMGIQVLAHPSFYFLLLSCAIWTTMGIVLFKWMENWSRDRGTLGVY